MINREFSEGCRAEQHHPSCPCLKCKPRECDTCPKISVQHEIPECIGVKLLGMSKEELSKYTHPQSKLCHAINDKNVNRVFKELLWRQHANGEVFTKEAILTLRKDGLFRQA